MIGGFLGMLVSVPVGALCKIWFERLVEYRTETKNELVEEKKMEFRFNPWMLDVDVKATQHDYSKNDYSKDKQLNEELKKAMSFQQSRIFETLGVDPDKILVEKIPLEVLRMFINFLLSLRKTSDNHKYAGSSI